MKKVELIQEYNLPLLQKKINDFMADIPFSKVSITPFVIPGHGTGDYYESPRPYFLAVIEYHAKNDTVEIEVKKNRTITQ